MKIWKNQYLNRELLNFQGNVIADQVTRLVVCNDQDEEDCKYLREGLEEKMTEQPSA